MSVTYTAADDRDARRTGRGTGRIDRPVVSMAATSCVAMLAIALAYSGRLIVVDSSSRATAPAPIDLNTVAGAKAIEAAMQTVVPDANDRRLAAERLFRFLGEERQKASALPNVGAIAPLFSPADFAKLKPLFTVRTIGEFRRQVVLFACLYIVAFQAPVLLWRLRRIRTDPVLLAVVHLITAIGFAVLLSRADPLRDSLTFVRFTEGTVIGVAVMMAVSLVDFAAAAFMRLSYLPLIGALSLSLLLILFGSGPGTSGAKVNLGPVQPIEAIRLLLALFLAGFFARRWEVLRDVRSRMFRSTPWTRWVNLPRAEYVMPVLAGVGLALVFFFIQKDLGPALFLCCVFLATYAVARGRVGMAIAGLALLILGFHVGYRLNISPTLAARVSMWQSPWDNAVPGGDQTTHAIWALATGGSVGTGLGLGNTRYLPAGHTDLILAAIGEELGAAGLLLVAVLYALVASRGFRVARLARNDYGFFLATALTLFLIMPVLIMASGILGVTPLTGVVTPFLSYGGSAMVANFCAVGMLTAIHADRLPSGDLEPFRVPVMWLGSSLASFALALLAVALNIQIVRADDYIVRPHLGVQADGGRRYVYNPRVLDIVRLMPRGTIYDRHGVPLATDDPRVIAEARQTYAALGVSLDEACPTAGERCYPLGGAAFHLLGDARTHVNWTASNSSYIERDEESQLRGFDDHAEIVHTIDSAGRSMLTIRRDYRDVLPALRHRYDPASPAWARFRQPHDVHLAIDANLQLRVAEIVAAYAQKTAGRAAAVVLDPDSGELMASASYPWPSADGSNSAPEVFLDRARYGLYPPGSTFKLVTASAALRQHLDPRRTTFTCTRLPDGRVGAKIPGWNRPVRDDVKDANPHGTIDVHGGFVHSCNAYFAQLAVKLGSRPIVDTASQLGISLTPAADVVARVRRTLPQIGYGQGDIVVTPLKMARAAAAIASNGILRDTTVAVGSCRPSAAMHCEPEETAGTAAGRFLNGDDAHVLADYMRDVVLSGTGRVLRNHPGRIAGKTGTAQLDRQPSHGWFVGFAPFGPATTRIAFAVVIENAGYGGGSAAPAAGQIVSVALRAGLLK
ncbi:MAG TPA: FtsW/RodA/SpoVE family cell cycle protein [Vicinamibacterales bacterium]|nr:FtsW/RodA/SpoVE family cell cycle protein [Vicinamibacterales bacterium]